MFKIFIKSVALVIVVSIVLNGCNRKALSFHSVDITGNPEFKADFALFDADHRLRTLAEFKGKIVVLFFGFIHCPDICPTALSAWATVRRNLGADGEKIQVIFISLDPERDTAEKIRVYLRAFDPLFLGLRTDDSATLKTVADNFKVYFQKVQQNESYTIDHTAGSYIIDAKGMLRLFTRPNQSAESLEQDIRLLF